METVESIPDSELIAFLRKQLAAETARGDRAEGEAAARLKQFLTQVEIHTRNTREWRVALDESAAHVAELRGALEGLRKIAEGEAFAAECDNGSSKPVPVVALRHIRPIITAALAGTPAESLSRVKSEVLREVATLIKSNTARACPATPYTDGLFHGKEAAISFIEDEIKRLEVGAGAGEGKHVTK